MESEKSGERVDQAGPATSGFWVRISAAMIDAVIVSLAFALLLGVGGALGLSDGETWLVQMAAFLTYGAAFAALMGGTPGKLVLGMKIVGVEGRRIGPFRACLRNFAILLSVYLLGVLMIALDKRKRGLHDYIANTLVVQGPGRQKA